MISRLYQDIIQHHIDHYDQMVFISGSRQVGKTTIAKTFATSQYSYLNWDNVKHREIILDDIYNYITHRLLNVASDTKPVLILDEIHKFKDWKNFVKGVYDQHKGELLIIVTGSARLNIYSKGGDSLMGRYFNYQIFPLSVHELMQLDHHKTLINAPAKVPQATWQRLYQMGGYPEPYIKNDSEFHTLWSSTRLQQLFREEIRDYTAISDVSQLELLGRLIANQVGSLTNYAQLAKKIRKSEGTVRAWYQLLKNIYYCFNIYLWSNNVSRSLLPLGWCKKRSTALKAHSSRSWINTYTPFFHSLSPCISSFSPQPSNPLYHY